MLVPMRSAWKFLCLAWKENKWPVGTNSHSKKWIHSLSPNSFVLEFVSSPWQMDWKPVPSSLLLSLHSVSTVSVFGRGTPFPAASQGCGLCAVQFQAAARTPSCPALPGLGPLCTGHPDSSPGCGLLSGLKGRAGAHQLTCVSRDLKDASGLLGSLSSLVTLLRELY